MIIDDRHLDMPYCSIEMRNHAVPSLAIIFDRDGTLIEHVHYLRCPSQVRLHSDTLLAIELAVSSGATLFLHTNQSGVGRGMFTLEDVHRVNAKMLELIGKGENLFRRICIAPEVPERATMYRKPGTGFADEIVRDFGIARKRIVYIGDSIVDLETAFRSGTNGVGVATGLVDIRRDVVSESHLRRYPIEDSLSKAVDHALQLIWSES